MLCDDAIIDRHEEEKEEEEEEEEEEEHGEKEWEEWEASITKTPGRRECTVVKSVQHQREGSVSSSRCAAPPAQFHTQAAGRRMLTYPYAVKIYKSNYFNININRI